MVESPRMPALAPARKFLWIGGIGTFVRRFPGPSMQTFQIQGKVMDFSQIIEHFANDERLPKAAVQAALSDPAAFVPKAAEMLARRAAGVPLSDTQEAAIGIVIHVLGEIGDERTFAPLMALLAIPSRDLDELLGDIITETLPGILMRLAGDNIASLEEAVFNPDVDEFTRDAILEAWAYFVLEGRIERDTARAFLSAFPEGAKKAGFGKDDHSWFGWMETVAQLQFRELMPLVGSILARATCTRTNWAACPR